MPARLRRRHLPPAWARPAPPHSHPLRATFATAGEERPFLAPNIDLLNFGQVGIRASYDNRRAGFVARTVQPIKAGAELLFYYGNFCIDDAVSMYGFAPSDAPPCKAAAKKRSKAKAKVKAGRRLLAGE